LESDTGTAVTSSVINLGPQKHFFPLNHNHMLSQFWSSL